MQRKIAISALLIAAVVAAGSGLALARTADDDDDNALADLAKAHITLAQAAVTAESQAGGRAIKAELESERGTVVFAVDVVTPDQKVFDVKIDAADGRVLSSQLDQADRDDEDDD